MSKIQQFFGNLYQRICNYYHLQC